SVSSHVASGASTSTRSMRRRRTTGCSRVVTSTTSASPSGSSATHLPFDSPSRPKGTSHDVRETRPWPRRDHVRPARARAADRRPDRSREVAMTAPAEVIDAYRCIECDTISDEHAGSLYECSNCGNVFTVETSPDGSHRCECGRFGAKIADTACI